jgi:EmrB/QacA subfamily drug resistance transporter
MQLTTVPGASSIVSTAVLTPPLRRSIATPVARRWAGLIVACVGMMMTFLNITVTTSTLPLIQADVHASGAEFVWVASIYTVVVASLVLSAGTLGDIFGRRTVFAAGTATMGAGSLVTALAGSPTAVIAGQAIMGIGGALVLTNSLAIVTHAFTDAHERTKAVSLWVAVSGVGLAIGPIAAGALLEAFSWHSAFLVNVVLSVVVLALTPALVPESKVAHRHLDPRGLALGVIAIGALNYAVIQGGHGAFGDTDVLAAIAVAVLAAAAFVTVEARSRTAMLHLPLFRIAPFSAANVIGFVGQYAFVGIALAQVLFLEQVRGDSVLMVGVHLLPMMVGYIVVSAVAGRIVRRIGARSTIALGGVVTAVALLGTLTQDPGTAYAQIGALLALFGIGAGLLLPPATATAVVSVPHAEGGMASATVNAFRQVGGALGASLTGTILTAGGSFTSALHLAALIPGLAALVAAGLAVVFIHGRPAGA